MPEFPDFETIARAAIARWALDDSNPVEQALIAEDLAKELRHMWNGRGAVDLAKVENRLFFWEPVLKWGR